MLVDYPSGERDWKCVMSDTPAEYADHRDLIECATGRVLLHGLGLGCALSAILAKPEVTHVDVVEANADVIDMIAPYYANYPVTVYRGSCVGQTWPVGTQWNFVFHDIWTWISAKNLADQTAESGISYRRMFELFADRCDNQVAWAYDIAIKLAQAESATPQM
jgi:hypothetical protein